MIWIPGLLRRPDGPFDVSFPRKRESRSVAGAPAPRQTTRTQQASQDPCRGGPPQATLRPDVAARSGSPVSRGPPQVRLRRIDRADGFRGDDRWGESKQDSRQAPAGASGDSPNRPYGRHGPGVRLQQCTRCLPCHPRARQAVPLPWSGDHVVGAGLHRRLCDPMWPPAVDPRSPQARLRSA